MKKRKFLNLFTVIFIVLFALGCVFMFACGNKDEDTADDGEIEEQTDGEVTGDEDGGEGEGGGEGGGGDVNPESPDTSEDESAKPVSVTLTVSGALEKINDTATATASVTMSEGASEYEGGYEWSSSNTQVASVTGSTDVPGQAIIQITGYGEAAISVGVGGGVSGTYEISIAEIPVATQVEVTIGESESLSKIGDTATATASVTMGVGGSGYGGEYEWSSSDTNVATVTPVSGTATATIKIVGAGDAIITVTVGENVSGTYSVSIADLTIPSSVTISAGTEENTGEAKIPAYVGDTLTLTATVVMPEGGEDYAGEYTWTSSDDTVATISRIDNTATATLTLVGEGSATITVTLKGGVAGTYTVSDVVDLSVPASATMGVADGETSTGLKNKDDTMTLKCDVTMKTAAGEDAAYSGDYTWTSTNSDVVSVQAVDSDNSTATITAVGAGTATITVTLKGGISASYTVTLAAAYVTFEVTSGYIKVEGGYGIVEAEVEMFDKQDTYTGSYTWTAATSTYWTVTGISGTNRAVFDVAYNLQGSGTGTVSVAASAKVTLDNGVTADYDETILAYHSGVNDVQTPTITDLSVSGTLGAVGDTASITATTTSVSAGKGHTTTYKGVYRWSSSDETVATVSPAVSYDEADNTTATATITIVGVGTAVITVQTGYGAPVTNTYTIVVPADGTGDNGGEQARVQAMTEEDTCFGVSWTLESFEIIDVVSNADGSYTYKITAMAGKMSTGQNTAFGGGDAQYSVEGDYYVSFKIFVKAGETVTCKTANKETSETFEDDGYFTFVLKITVPDDLEGQTSVGLSEDSVVITVTEGDDTETGTVYKLWFGHIDLPTGGAGDEATP
ncbi:MAG: Ig-like domain-containing protein [Bacteroidales bacterium]|nr:Ig-like domain-containing protein [Bacteroidales bacterium]